MEWPRPWILHALNAVGSSFPVNSSWVGMQNSITLTACQMGLEICDATRAGVG